MADNASVRWLADGNSPKQLHLEMRHQPLTKILDGLADKTGMAIHYSALPESPVDAVCTGSAVAVLHCLLDKKADYIFRYPQEVSEGLLNRMPEEVWVVGKNDVVLEGGILGTAYAGVQGAETDLKKDGGIAHLLEMAKSEDPNLRADAIASLANEGAVGDQTIHKTLIGALSDKNARIRKQAVASLAIREGGKADQELQLALQDSDASVRLMAVDSIKDNQQLLLQALSDSDETVHTLAAMKLEKMAKAVGN